MSEGEIMRHRPHVYQSTTHTWFRCAGSTHTWLSFHCALMIEWPKCSEGERWPVSRVGGLLAVSSHWVESFTLCWVLFLFDCVWRGFCTVRLSQWQNWWKAYCVVFQWLPFLMLNSFFLSTFSQKILLDKKETNHPLWSPDHTIKSLDMNVCSSSTWWARYKAPKKKFKSY